MINGGATHVGVATDHVIESFRNRLWPGYKTGEGIEPELLAQFPLLEEALIARWASPSGRWSSSRRTMRWRPRRRRLRRDPRVERVLICTPDKDLAQCVRGTRVVQLNRRTRRSATKPASSRSSACRPQSIPDYLALVGDAADGYPGLPGWGAKSAAAVRPPRHRLRGPRRREEPDRPRVHRRGRRATVLSGRCLPYGEGITYWPLAEMVKSSAGISDDEPIAEAVEKLRDCCGDEAVADLLGLASGLLDRFGDESGAQEIAWAAQEWAIELAAAQPLILCFEDIHWAEEPLLDLIEQLAERAKSAPLLIVCLARPELLDVRPGWGGGRLRAAAIELQPLDAEQSATLVDALLADEDLAPGQRAAVLEKAEGNPLFVEETVRMLLERVAGTPKTGFPTRCRRSSPRASTGCSRGRNPSCSAPR